MGERGLLPDASSEFIKGSRVERGHTHEKTEAAKRTGVSGQTVHRRGFIPVAAAEQKLENAGEKALRPLLDDIEQKVERLTQVAVWLEGEGIRMESKYEGEEMTLLRFIANSFRAAKDSAGPYLEDATNTLVETTDFQADKEKIEEIQDRFVQLLEILKDQVAGLESDTGEDHRDVPAEIKVLLEESAPAELSGEAPNSAEPGDSLANPGPESGPDAEAEAKFAELENSVQKWLGIRGRIRDLAKGTAFDDAMLSLPAPDFAKHHKSEEAERVIRLWRRLLAQGKKPDEELQTKIEALERNLAKMIPAGETLLASLEAAQGGSGKEDQEAPVRFADYDRDELLEEFEGQNNRAKIIRLQAAHKSLRLMVQEVVHLGGWKELSAAVANLPGKELIRKGKREQKESELRDLWQANQEKGTLPEDIDLKALLLEYHDVLVAAEAVWERLQANPPKEVARSERAEGVTENPGPALEAELQEKWRAMRGNPEAKVAAVETLLAEWKEVSETIRQFSDETRVRSDIVGSGLEPRKFEKIFASAENEKQVEARLEVIRKNMEANPALSDEDAGFLTANFHNYHQLIAAARSVVRERERETAVMAAEEAAEDNPENDPTPKEKFLQANELITRWRGLCDEFGVIRLRKAIRKKYPREMELPVVPDIDAWLEKHRDLKAWRGRSAQRNQARLDAHLVDLAGLVKDAELVAADIRSRRAEKIAVEKKETEEPETRGNVTVLATGRTIESDEQMTAWEKLDSDKAKEFKRLVSMNEFNDFQGRLRAKLSEKGITNSVDRLRIAQVALEQFMPGHIRKLAKKGDWNIEITDDELEKVFMVGLRKNLLVS